MIPVSYRTEIRDLLTKLQPLSQFNTEAFEIYMSGLGLITTIEACDAKEIQHVEVETDSIIHQVEKFEKNAEVFLGDMLHFNH